jgi:hypothetical protein
MTVNGLNSLIERHRLTDYIQSKTQSFVAYKKCTSLAQTNICFTVKRFLKILQVNGAQKVSKAAIFAVDFKPKLVRDKEVHFSLIKGTIKQEKITIINIYTH